MYELKTLNHILAFIDRLVGKISIKKGQNTIISVSAFGMMMTSFCKFSYFTERLSHYGIHQHMVNATSSVMFFVFLMLIVASLDMNEDEDVKLNVWLGIPLLLVVISYTVTGIIEKAPKQLVWAFVYSFIFVPISYRLASKKNKKIFIDGIATGIAIFGVLILFLNIIFSPMVAKTSFSIARYTGVLTNPTILGFYLNVFIVVYAYIIYKKVFVEKNILENVSNLIVFSISVWGMGMSWFAILMTKSRGSFLGILSILLFYTIIVMKGVFKSHLKFKNAAIIIVITVTMLATAYKISDNILKRDLRALKIKENYTISQMMFGRIKEMSNFKDVDEYHFAYMEPKNLTEAQRKIWSDLDKLTTHRIWIWYIYSQHLGFIGHKSRTFIIPGYTKGFERQSHNAILEVTFNGGYIAGFGFLLIEITTGIYALIILFRKKEYTDNNLEMLFLSLAAIAFCVNGIFSTINTLTTYSITMMYYMALTTVGFRKSDESLTTTKQ